MRRTRRALVVGCGLAGSAAAWWLHDAGWDVVLVDRETEPHPGSYLLLLDTTALDVLARMGAADVVARSSHPAPGLSLRWAGRRGAHRLDLGDADERDGGWRLASRSSLVAGLFALVPPEVDIRLGVGLEALESRSQDVLARFGDGAVGSFDMVVGADGLHSTVRDLVLAPESRSVYRNGVTHVWVNADRAVPGERAVLSAHDGTLLQVVPYRGAGRTMVVAALPVPAAPDERVLVDRVGDVIADLGPDLQDLADAVRVSSEVKLTRFSQVRLPRWHTRRVVLLGDAAHCLDPISGQGAHAALLGAVSLVEALAEHGSDLTSAFEQYESRMRPYAKLTQHLTAHVTEYVTRTRRGRPATVRAGLGDAARALLSMLLRNARHTPARNRGIALASVAREPARAVCASAEAVRSPTPARPVGGSSA